jgi:hypothetical protein
MSFTNRIWPIHFFATWPNASRDRFPKMPRLGTRSSSSRGTRELGMALHYGGIAASGGVKDLA